jgi:hypothetical protein
VYDARILMSTRRRFVALFAAALLFAVAAAPADPECTCPQARLTDGWCDVHHVGYVAMVRIPSRLLYDTLDAHGHVLDLSTFTCPGCRKAIDGDGFCEEHRIGFVRKQAYFSRLTYEIARGERLRPEAVACPVCRADMERTGWCDKHRVGWIGNVAIANRPAYERAAAAVAILREAVDMLPRCEHCSEAMVTDQECPIHRITYQGGKPVPKP